MNFQIAGDQRNPVSEIGLPAKRVKSDQPPKPVDICHEVTTRLHLSSSRVQVPEKARTACLQSSSLPKPSPSFDFLFVENDNAVRHLLSAQTHNEKRDVVIISHPDDLSQTNLVSRLRISDDGGCSIQPGKLFEGTGPLTLVMDIRKLTSEDLPKFNDLLDPDNPCLYDKVSKEKRPLGEHVSLLVVADPEQLASVGKSEDAPGADFWRRINRPGNTWRFGVQADNGQSVNISNVPPVLAEFPCAEGIMEDGDTVLIDCHLHSNWRQLLFGGPGVDKQGRIRHMPGKLEQLKAGQQVILKGANWNNLAFEQTIRQLVSQKHYESNGVVCHLPEDVQFYQMPVGDDELRSLFQTMTHDDKELAPNAPRNPLIINQSNITEWLSPICIGQEGFAVPNTSLLEQVQAGAVVTVTSPLSESLWFRLLGALQSIHKATGVKPQLQVAHILKQPKSLGLEASHECPLPNTIHLQAKTGDHASFNTVTYQQHTQANHWINGHQEAPLVIQVNDQTSFGQLFDNIHITSEQNAHFGRRQSKLQAALTTGKRVVFRGLESNPRLQQCLEPLMCGQPLLVNGKLQAYPEARITILWPELEKSPSSVWRSMITAGEPCPEVDIWDINAVNHGIPRAELPEQVLDQLYKAFETVPAALCKPLPEMTNGLLNNLILAARRAQQVDHALQLQPCHWRKAINSVLTHGTRQNPSVRDFMKVACYQLLPDVHKKPHKKPDEDQTAWVDPDRLNAFINSAQRLDREFVEQNAWQLARAYDPTVFKGAAFKELQLSYKNPLPWYFQTEYLEKLCALIVAYAPEEQRNAVAYQLKVDPAEAEQYKQLAIRPSSQIKRLEDALASGWQLRLQSAQTRSDAIHSLAADCVDISRRERVTENREAECIERISMRLSQSLEWHGSTDKPLLALAHDLYHGSINQKDRESRRLSRLHDRFSDSPVIFLQGETGTGKSYFSEKMARASGQTSVISLGPSDSEQTLMQRWQWQEGDDNDRYMEQQNRALLEWANTQPTVDGHYVTLVLDEANLANTGLLASLNGLWEPEPCIYVNGHSVKVSPQHRVILTGNPDHYAGRQLDPALQEKLPRAYYPPLNRAFLRDRVVEPALLSQLQRHLPEQQINHIARSVTESVMALWQYYPELLPEHEFTPRDLTDICSWLGWYLDCALPNMATPGSITTEQMNGLTLQCFRDVLGSEITHGKQDFQTALERWFSARYPLDSTLSDNVHNQTLLDIKQAFMKVTAETRPEFDTSGSAVSELVQRLGQDLSRCQQAFHHGRKHGGRQATLIEGPAGRGKDATLNLLIESVKQQAEQRGESMPKVFTLNACDCSWEKLCEAIQWAKVHGGIVVISEMNLIDSQHLEGELNDILAGDAHPGFHLFATTNPPEYSGRKPLSPALKGRFRHLPVRQYNPAELQTIVEKVLPQTPQGKSMAETLTQWHCRLRSYLQQQNLPLQPFSRDLQNVAKAVLKDGDFTENTFHQYINQYYQLYLMAAKTSLEKLPGLSAMTIGKGVAGHALCDWFNRTVSGIDRPWLIRRDAFNRIDEKSHEIRIKAHLSEAEARTEIIKMVARAQWQASGLSLNPRESDDNLTQAFYRHWQRRWFDHGFGRTGVDVNTVFALTKEQEHILQFSGNQPYLQEADKQISAWDARAVQLWPAFWHQLSNLLNHAVSDSIDEELEVGKSAQVKSIPQVQEVVEKDRSKAFSGITKGIKSAKLLKTLRRVYSNLTGSRTCAASTVASQEKKAPASLDRATNYKHREIPQRDVYKIFNTDVHDSQMYRWWAKDIYVTADGDVIQIPINDKALQGGETLKPARLPGHDQEVTLAPRQTLATLDMSSNNGQYELPSLKPSDYIVALRIEPDLPFTLVRDRYTGLHTLFMPGAKAGQRIHFAYVVETGTPGKETCAKEARAERSTRFDASCSKWMKKGLDKLFVNIAQHPQNVQALLRTIQSAEDTELRIKAITHYCKQFSGEAEPADDDNFFEFLITQRQGSCRHRVPVFIAFCRYFEIPSRLITNSIHAFAEYSGDGGRTWESVDLGGSPVQMTEITPKFQPTRQGRGSSTESKKIKDLSRNYLRAIPEDLLKGADIEQQQPLAKACGLLSLEEMQKVFEAGCALPETDLSTSMLVRKLWERKDLTGLAMGISIIEAQEALDYDEQQLIGDYYDGYNTYKPLSAAVKQILSSSDEDQVTQLLHLLNSLHSKMIVQCGACAYQWLGSIVDILEDSNLAHPPVIHFAHEAFESGRLDPMPNNYSLDIYEHHDLLVRLAGVDELKANAVSCLKKWYRNFLSREKNNQQWREAYKAYKSNQKKNGYRFFVTHCHDGFSSFLEEKITSPSLQTSWTDEPEGIPDIERMLVGNPAFPQFISGKTNHRPVLIVGQPSWCYTIIDEKVEALFQRKVENSSELKQILGKIIEHDEIEKQLRKELDALYEDILELREEHDKKSLDIVSRYKPILKPLEVSSGDRARIYALQNKCKRAIQQAFSHYLYRMTHSKGSRLTYCWVDIYGIRYRGIRYGWQKNGCGAHEPSSPEELYAMMSTINSNSKFEQSSLNDTYLREANNASNALVLKSGELTKIANEFLNNVNLSSINDSGFELHW